MELKNFLNEFEYDWAAFPAQQKKFPAQKLQNKTVLVSGGHHGFARCVVYSLFAANDLHSLSMKIILVGRDSSAITGYFPQLLKRQDFQFFTFEQACGNGQLSADYFIYTGCCNKRLEQTPEFFINEIGYAKEMLSLAHRVKAQRFVLLSDYRRYGVLERGVLASEYEDGTVDFSRASAFECELVQTIESLCPIYAKQLGFSYVILRTGIALGACTGFDDSIITDLFKAVAKGEEYRLLSSKNKYSFVYISDILNAVFHAMTRLRENTLYNVVGKKSTVSIGMLIATLHDIYPEDTKVSLDYSEKDPCYGAAMNNQKIVCCGCKPKISLEDAIQLLVESSRVSDGQFVFKDSYQGKLSIIQNILLGYLLDIDRICRKHHIRYFLAGGTLLGAVRHHGFIPWDDDADVMMLREDYDKFLQVAQSELPPNVTLHTADTDPLNYCIFTKLRIDNTMFATKYTSKFLDMHNGLFFDVLSHDNTANSKLGRKIHLQLTLLTRSLVFNKWHHRKIDNGHKFQSFVANILKAILPLPFCEKLQFKCLKWFENKKDAKYLYDGMGRNVYKGDFPKEWLSETVYWDFEGYRFPIPKEYDKYLRYLYGDYENMVIASSRKTSHSIIIMDLGEYAHFKRPQTKEQKEQLELLENSSLKSLETAAAAEPIKSEGAANPDKEAEEKPIEHTQLDKKAAENQRISEESAELEAAETKPLPTPQDEEEEYLDRALDILKKAAKKNTEPDDAQENAESAQAVTDAY